MPPARKYDPFVVKVTRVHPFRLFLMQTGRREGEAAKELGITHAWLSRVLNGQVDASAELYRDFSRYSNGAVTLKELVAYRVPSTHRRRKMIDVTPLRKARKTTAPEKPKNDKGTIH